MWASNTSIHPSLWYRIVCSLNKKYIVITAAILGITILLVSVSDLGLMSAIPTSHAQVPKGKVFVMYAASLIRTFEELRTPFQGEQVILWWRTQGSIQVVNMITDELRKPDIFVSAGTIPIKKLMNNTPRLADWLVKFGSAEMVIAYSHNSRLFHDLEKARTAELPWYYVLSRQDFKFGRTDPELDPKDIHDLDCQLANLYIMRLNKTKILEMIET